MSDFARELALLGLKKANALYPGAFYGSSSGLAAGAGLIYSGLTYAIYNEAAGRYQARKGPVLILTHECDIDQSNDRYYNERFVFAPLILMKEFAASFESLNRKDEARGLVQDTARCFVNRLVFLPPSNQLLPVKDLEFGALIYWNTLSSTHVEQLAVEGCQPICALSDYGLEQTDRLFKQHFLRPKSDALPKLN